MSGIDADRWGDKLAIALIFAATNLRQRHRALHDQKVNLAGYQVGHRGSCAAIRNELDFLPGQFFEKHGCHIGRSILIDEVDLARICLHPTDEILQVVGRKIFLGDHELRIDSTQGR